VVTSPVLPCGRHHADDPRSRRRAGAHDDRRCRAEADGRHELRLRGPPSLMTTPKRCPSRIKARLRNSTSCFNRRGSTKRSASASWSCLLTHRWRYIREACRREAVIRPLAEQDAVFRQAAAAAAEQLGIDPLLTEAEAFGRLGRREQFEPGSASSALYYCCSAGAILHGLSWSSQISPTINENRVSAYKSLYNRCTRGRARKG
jgi:hypothetical protein